MPPKSLRSMLKLSSKKSPTRPESPSIRILREALVLRGISRKRFVQEADLSYEYVSRVMNSKVNFPAVRETLERFAQIAELDPMVFVEYRKLVQNLPESTRKLWKYMEEQHIHRRDFADRVGFSKTYAYEILRGDVPFPNNPAVIEKIASAVNVSPDVFAEYLAPVLDWANENPQAVEQVFLNVLMTQMLMERGYWKGKKISLSRTYEGFFAPEDSIHENLRKIYAGMGRKKTTLYQLCLELDIPHKTLWPFLSGEAYDEELARILKKHLVIRR